MAMIYRRTPHGGGGARLTTTIPLNGDAPPSQLQSSPSQQHLPLDEDNNDKDDDDLPASASSRGRVASRWLRCYAWRSGVSSPLPTRTLAPTPASSALRFRVGQILWQALLVYAFFGLPVLGRILNFCRFLNRFSAISIVTGLLVGFFQDFAIFVQVSTVIVLIKALFQPVAIQRRLSAMAAASASSAPPLGGSNAALATERYPHSYGGGPRYVHVPVYFPVRTNEYEMPGGTVNTSDTDPLDPSSAHSQSTPPKHLTLVASSSSSATSFPWSLSSSTSSLSPAAMALYKTRTCCASVVTVLLLKLVLVLATIASVADFCLQVTMHPRLNRAFVEIFYNYMGKFTGSLMDEEVLTPPVVFIWATYFMLIATMTYGYYTERLPFLPDMLFCWSPSTSKANGSSWCCVRTLKRLTSSCTGIVKRRSYRKDSSLPLPSSAHEMDHDRHSANFIKLLYRSYWRRKDSDIVILNETSSGLTSAVSAANPSHPQRRRRNSNLGGHGTTMLGLRSSSSVFGGSGTGHFIASSSASWMKPKSPLAIVLHCILASLFVTLGALCVSLLVHTSGGAMSRSNSTSKYHGLIGVDMHLMANPMFSLQTENFFAKKSRVGTDHINCTQASATLRATLGKSEVYDMSGMGNSDSCALLWRKTTAYKGETLWDIEWKNVTRDKHVETVSPSSSPAETNASANSSSVAPLPPNIIVINMESWRHLDVGVLGGADKKRQFGKSATPNFDRFSREGVLYRKHYTPCVQTTRTLLTTLFGVLPSCTESAAIKTYGTALTVRGLPQFLKSRGYFNMFWSAVDLTWEYWDHFLTRNGFDKLVDDNKVRKMLHETRAYEDRDDDHFSWGMHDDLSFEMLLYAIEFAKNSTKTPMPTLENVLTVNSSTTTNGTMSGGSHAMTDAKVEGQASETNVSITDALSRTPTGNPHGVAATKSQMRSGRADHGKQTAHVDPVNDGAARRMKPTVGWEGLREPYFIDMYTITSHNPWALPLDYEVPDLSELYTRVNKRYIDSMYFSDDMLGKFIDAMRAKGLMNNTIVVIEGDHGYGRLEHDNNPSVAESGVWDEAAHVPFLILADDFLSADQRGREVDQLTMQSDLMATIADILGVSEDEPLLQHGLGHSMRRKRATAPVLNGDGDVPRTGDHAESERRVVLCNPFDGITKGVRTEETKYIYNPDGSFKVFTLASDPIEKKPIASGYDIDQMDTTTRDMLDFVSEQVDLNQFLFETNKFTGEMPMPVATRKAVEGTTTDGARASLKEGSATTTAEPTAPLVDVESASQADHKQHHVAQDDAMAP
jgi:arylsulfatase A-like enzyme